MPTSSTPKDTSRSLSARAGGKSKAATPPEKLYSTAASRMDNGDTTGLVIDGIVSADVLIDQFRGAMSALLQDNLAAISKELETIKFACSDLDNRVEKLERENASLRETVTSLKGTVELRESATRNACTSVDTVHAEVFSSLSKTVDDLRRDTATTFIINGLPEVAGGSTTEQVGNLLSGPLASPQASAGIALAERLGEPRRADERPRPILVTAKSAGDCQKVLSLRRKLRQTPHTEGKVYFNENLTKSERDTRRSLQQAYATLREAEHRCFLRGNRIEVPANEDHKELNFYTRETAEMYVKSLGLTLTTPRTRLPQHHKGTRNSSASSPSQ